MAAHRAPPSLGFSRQEHWSGLHFLLQCMKVKSERKSLSHVRLLANPWTAAYQALPSMGFSRQECWSGVSLPSPMKNLDSILKRTHITLPTKVHMVHMVKPMSFFFFSTHIWMWELDLKAEHQRTDAFQLWCWRRLLRVPWAAKRSKQSILKEINSENSLEKLKLKLQHFGHLIGKDPDGRKDWG